MKDWSLCWEEWKEEIMYALVVEINVCEVNCLWIL